MRGSESVGEEGVLFRLFSNRTHTHEGLSHTTTGCPSCLGLLWDSDVRHKPTVLVLDPIILWGS